MLRLFSCLRPSVRVNERRVTGLRCDSFLPNLSSSSFIIFRYGTATPDNEPQTETDHILFPAAKLTANMRKYCEVYSAVLPICTDATAIKVMFKCCGRVSGCASNPYFELFVRVLTWGSFYLRMHSNVESSLKFQQLHYCNVGNRRKKIPATNGLFCYSNYTTERKTGSHKISIF